MGGGGRLSTNVELRVLGPVELIGRDGTLHLGGPHQRAIVALLALHAGDTVATGDVIDGLWGEAPPQHVRKSLSTQLARVRRPLAAIGAAVVHTGAGYRLDLPADCLDLQRFEQAERHAAELAAAQLWPRAITRQREALGLWRGAPFADLGSFPFAQSAATWLGPRRAAAEDRLADFLLAAGEAHDAAQLLERLVEDNPYDERRWAQLVRALSAGGRRRDALLAYQRAREKLGEGLGLDPGPELREVERIVLAGEAEPQPPLEGGRPVAAFIGRTVELDRIDHALERAGRGALQAVAVLGEPGIGRSRLLDELTARLQARGVTVLRGAGEPTQTVPLRCLLAALDPWLADPVFADALGIDPSLLRLDEPPRATAVVEPTGLDVRRYRVIASLSRTLRELATPGPAVLVLDDVHWIDPFSAAVLDHLCAEFPRLPLLVVAAASTTASTWPSVEEQLVHLERAISVERLTMRPLSAAEVEALVRQQVVGVTDLEPLVEQIQVASGGNALYATQLAAAASAAGRLPDAVPQGLDALCRARVAAAPSGARDLLDAAAVLGADVLLDPLAAILGTTVEDVEGRAEELRRAGLLVPSDQHDRVRFSHGVIRQVIYDDLPIARRRRLHQRAAEALAPRSTDTSAGDLALAHHLREAGPLVSDERVAAALEAAARHAARQGALEVSRQLLEEAADRGSPAQLASISIALGMVAVAEGDLAGVTQIEAGAQAARAEGRWDLVADAAIARSQLAASPGVRHALALAADIEEALDHLDQADLARRGLLLSWRAYLLVNVDAERSAEAIDAAEAYAARVSNPQIDAAIRYTRLRQAESFGVDPAACEREALQLVADVGATGDRSLASYGHVAAQAARVRGGRFDECRAAQASYMAAAVEGHQRAIELQLAAVDTALAFATGSVSEIDTASRALFDRLSAASVPSAPAVRFVQQLFVERERGARPRWEPVMRQVAAAPLQANEPIVAAGLLSLGDEAAAAAALAPFLARLGELPRDWSHDALVAVAAEVVSDLGQTGPHVEQLYEELLPSQGQVVTLTSVVAVLGRVDRYLGRLAHLAGDLDTAVTHLETARQLDDAAGSGLWSGWAARDEAAARRARGASGDRSAAEELHDLARARARSHGSDRLASALP